mmetsp:Transcript_37658/g.88660  ORF Transcript_37658/g.88660 Transcript_37658/m.88660 type:complete len:247 (+) Transcript_37658:1135-1875(+)
MRDLLVLGARSSAASAGTDHRVVLRQSTERRVRDQGEERVRVRGGRFALEPAQRAAVPDVLHLCRVRGGRAGYSSGDDPRACTARARHVAASRHLLLRLHGHFHRLLHDLPIPRHGPAPDRLRCFLLLHWAFRRGHRQHHGDCAGEEVQEDLVRRRHPRCRPRSEHNPDGFRGVGARGARLQPWQKHGHPAALPRGAASRGAEPNRPHPQSPQGDSPHRSGREGGGGEANPPQDHARRRGQDREEY